MFESFLRALLALPLPAFAPVLPHPVSAAPWAARPSVWRNSMELRVDVHPGAQTVDQELKALHARLERTGLLAHTTGFVQPPFPDLRFRHREADGEHYIYVEDAVHGGLAGYTVFNRLVEVNRQLDRFIRAPHSKYATGYQRRGIATAVYEWALGQGFCLVSGARQSRGANALWQALATRHRLEYIEIRDKRLHGLGTQVDPATLESLQTRMLLLGVGWDVLGVIARSSLK